jgi:hypothetical protein
MKTELAKQNILTELTRLFPSQKTTLEKEMSDILLTTFPVNDKKQSVEKTKTLPPLLSLLVKALYQEKIAKNDFQKHAYFELAQALMKGCALRYGVLKNNYALDTIGGIGEKRLQSMLQQFVANQYQTSLSESQKEHIERTVCAIFDAQFYELFNQIDECDSLKDCKAVLSGIEKAQFRLNLMKKVASETTLTAPMKKALFLSLSVLGFNDNNALIEACNPHVEQKSFAKVIQACQKSDLEFSIKSLIQKASDLNLVLPEYEFQQPIDTLKKDEQVLSMRLSDAPTMLQQQDKLDKIPTTLIRLFHLGAFIDNHRKQLEKLIKNEPYVVPEANETIELLLYHLTSLPDFGQAYDYLNEKKVVDAKDIILRKDNCQQTIGILRAMKIFYEKIESIKKSDTEHVANPIKISTDTLAGKLEQLVHIQVQLNALHQSQKEPDKLQKEKLASLKKTQLIDEQINFVKTHIKGQAARYKQFLINDDYSSDFENLIDVTRCMIVLALLEKELERVTNQPEKVKAYQVLKEELGKSPLRAGEILTDWFARNKDALSVHSSYFFNRWGDTSSLKFARMLKKEFKRLPEILNEMTIDEIHLAFIKETAPAQKQLIVS